MHPLYIIDTLVYKFRDDGATFKTQVWTSISKRESPALSVYRTEPFFHTSLLSMQRVPLKIKAAGWRSGVLIHIDISWYIDSIISYVWPLAAYLPCNDCANSSREVVGDGFGFWACAFQYLTQISEAAGSCKQTLAMILPSDCHNLNPPQLLEPTLGNWYKFINQGMKHIYTVIKATFFLLNQKKE